MQNIRARAWTCILYPGELPENFIDLLDSLHIPTIISPLHSLDPDNIDPDEQRKDHHHLYLYFEGKKSFEQVERILTSVFSSHSGWSVPFEVASAKALIRYFLHLDQPEKQQFYPNPWDKLILLSGVKVDDYLEPSSSEKSMYIAQMQEWCLENGCYEISDLQDEARVNHYDTWNYLLNTSCLFVMKSYLDSRRHKCKPLKNAGVSYDPETGEII